MHLLVAIVAAIFMSSIVSMSSTYQDINRDRVERRKQAAIEDAGSLVKLYQSIYYTLPSNLTQIENFANSIGQRVDLEFVELAFVNSIIGGTNRYQRVVLFVQNDLDIKDSSSYLSTSSCSLGHTDDAGFCGDSLSKYAVINSDDFIQEQITMMNLRINETFYKVSQTYNGRTIGFPNVLSNGSTLAPNSSSTLAAFVGYSGSANACQGTHRFQSMHLNCSDLFDQMGNPVVYYYKNSREVFLVVQTPFLDSVGNQIIISRYAKV